ncbi:MAG: hypothetical protein NTW25_04040 [Candidatus Kapabacteria bacterium]|nr:hypothetical protein [Candidatus Kapabacteria bacterium]
MKFSILSFIQTIVFGMVLIIGFALLIGNNYAVPTLPIIAMVSGFIICGILVGMLSKGITILEPGVGAIVISICVYFLFPELGIKAFISLSHADWLLILLNSTILTFAGAWLGEKLQNGIVGSDEIQENSKIDWSWVFAGSILGITTSLLFVNLEGLDMIYGFFAFDPDIYYIPYFIVLFGVGVIVGWMSPGVTIVESAIAGFITLNYNMTIVHLTLYSFSPFYIIIGLLLGLTVTYFGGWVGEIIQSKREAKKALKVEVKS